MAKEDEMIENELFSLRKPLTRHLKSMTVLGILGLMLVPQAFADNAYQTNDTAQGFTLGVATSLRISAIAGVNYEYSHTGTHQCGGPHINEDTISVSGSISGSGRNGQGTWTYLGLTYRGTYGLSLPAAPNFGVDEGTSTLTLDGYIPSISGNLFHLHYEGSGPTIVSLVFTSQPCP
ncbi:MAG: hypothetical protein LC623_02370 [Halobacteriales archaeon]|nr:hypothetical protein [Halobacteriales archaeon]